MNPFDETLEDLPDAPAPQQAAQQDTNPFMAIEQEVIAEREGRLRSIVRPSTTTTPDTEAEALKLSTTTGIPIDVVRRNLGTVRTRAKVAETPYPQILEQTPALAEWLSKDPVNAGVAADDMENLGLLEWIVTAPQRAFQQSLSQMRAGELRTQSLFRPLTLEERDRLNAEKFYSEQGGALGAGDSWFRGSVTGGSKLLANILQAGYQSSGRALFGGAVGGILGGGSGLLAGGVGAIPGFIAGAKVGAGVGATVGGLEFGFTLEAGSAYDEFLEFKDETGQTIDPDAAKAAAFAAGALNAGVEVLQLGRLARSIPGVNKLVGQGGRTAVKAALRNPSIRAALASAMKEYAGVLTFETMTEVAQRAVTIMAGELAKGASGIEGQTGGEIAAELGREAVGALQGFALVGLPGPTMQAARGAQRAKRAEADVAFFQALGEGVAQSKTFERAPAAVEAFIESATPLKTVYAPVDTWTTYWQSKGVDPREMATAVTNDPQAYDTATQTGEPLAIPTSKYAVTLAGTEHNAFFANELRLDDPTAMNGREKDAFLEAQKQVTEEPTVATEPTGEAQVAAQIAEQLVTGGQYRQEDATALGRLFAKTAVLVERAGGDVSKVFERYGITVRRPDSVQPSNAGAPPSTVRTGTSVIPADLDATELPLETQADTPTVQALEPGAAASDAGAGLDGLATPAESPVTAGPAAPASGATANVDNNEATAQTEDAARYGPELSEGRVAGAPGRGRLHGLASSRPRSQENEPSRYIRRKPGESKGSIDSRRASFVRQHRRERADEHAAGVRQFFLDAALQADPQADLDQVAREFDFRIDYWQEQQQLRRDAGGNPLDLLRAIAKMGGINTVDGANPGEVRLLMEGQRFGKVAGVAGVFTKDGKPLEQMAVDLSRDDERFAWIEERPDLLFDAIDNAIRNPIPEEHVYPGTDELIDALQIDPDTTWWLEPWGGPKGRTEFEQTLIDLFDNPQGKPEQQPRLPGAEEVRDTDVPTPTFEAPFALTPEVSKAKKGKQTTLFQSAYHGSPHIFEKFSLHAIGSGEGAQAYGWGLYFASKRRVAEGYRERLANPQLEFPDGEILDGRDYEGIAEKISDDFGSMRVEDPALRSALMASDTGALIESGLHEHGGDLAKAEAFLRKRGSSEQVDRWVSTYLARPLAQRMADFYIAAAEIVKTAQARGVKPARSTGRTYTVEIPEDTDYLDWDKPASQQSPKVKEALKALGIKWVETEYPTLSEAAEHLGKMLEEPERPGWGSIGTIVRESILEGYDLARSGDEAAFRRWYDSHSGTYGAENRNPKGNAIYKSVAWQEGTLLSRPGEPEGRASSERAASAKLASLGIAGIRYLDGFSRNAGEGSSNYVVFDDALVEITEFDQRLAGENDLIVTHNLTAANLLHSEKMGGLAIPSMAITRKGEALTGFGEITLIGHAEMADPQGYANTKVYGADIYSPRYPTIHYKIDAKGEKVLATLFREFADATGERYIDLDGLTKEGPKYLRHSSSVMAAFLKERGIAFPAPVMDTREYRSQSGIDTFQTRYAFEEVIRTNDLQSEFEAYAQSVFDSMGTTEKIYKGYTYSGRPSYQPHTLENVVKILKKEMVGGEAQSNIYGMGQLRAKFTPRFRSLKGIRDAKKLLVSKEKMEEVKSEVDTEFFAIADALRTSYQPDANTFRYSDTVIAVLEDAPKRGLRSALLEYGFEDVSDDVLQQIGDLLSKLRTLPTEYFEAKILREVDLAEFAGAAVPEGTSDKVLEALKRRGVTNIVTYPKNDEAARRAAVAGLADALGEQVLFQAPTDRSARKGSIVFDENRKVTINLFAQADLSTFIHETGHFFLELFGDLVEDMPVDPTTLTADQKKVLADYGALLKWFGVENRKQITRAHHEQFARSFERYLMEGRAPSFELRELFVRFSRWLKGVYAELKNLNAPLTDEVRGVFDRMLASDQAIAEAEALERVAPMFLSADQAGMSPSQFALYADAIGRASQTARDTLERRILRDHQQQKTAEWKAAREAIEATVTEQVDMAPAYRALAAIQRGTQPDGSPLVEGMDMEPMKLSKAILVQRFGPEILRSLPKPAVYTTDGGLDPDTVAGRFGFDSGSALIQALVGLTPRGAAIQQETDRRMIAEHGDLLLDGRLPELALEALANEDRDLVIRAEIRALGQLRRLVDPFVKQAVSETKATEQAERAYERRWFEAEAKLKIAEAKAGKQEEIDALRAEVRNLRAKARGGAATIRAGIPPAGAMKQAALERIGRMTLKQIKPAVFWSASRQAAQRAIDLAARQDFDGAIVAKQQELMNLALFREAERALEEIETRVKAARAAGKPAALAQFGRTFGDQIAGILDRFGLASVPKAFLDRKATAVNFQAGIDGEGIPIDLPNEVLDESRRVPYRDLSYDEFIGVTDGLKQLVHLARNENRLLKAAAKADLQALAASLAESIRAHATRVRREGARDRRPSEERKRGLEWYWASQRKLASVLREMDGFQDGGPMWEAIMRPLNDAGSREAEMVGQATESFGRLIERAYPKAQKARLYDKLHIPAIGKSLSKMERIVVAFHWGNREGRERIQTNEKWSEAQVQAVLDTLDARDLEFVQGVFDFINSYWPEAAAKQERLFGVAPTKVEAMEIRAAAGTIAGGYYPLKYDERRNAKAIAALDLDAANIAKHAAYGAATPKRNYTKERVRSVKMDVRLDFGVMFEHVAQVIHDLTHHEALIDVGRILGHAEVQAAILETQGDQVFRQIRNTIRDVAFGDVPARTALEKGLNHIRVGATVAALGWNFTTMAFQPLGVFNAIVRVGPRWVGKGVSRWLRDTAHFENTAVEIREKSAFMRTRWRTQDVRLHEIRNKLGVDTGKLNGWIDEAMSRTTFGVVTRQAITDSFFWTIQVGQKVADILAWRAGYEKAMASGVDDAKAVALADQAVLDSQGGGQIKDLAEVQRGGPALRIWTNFFSAFSVLHNQGVESWQRTKWKDPASVARLASDYLLLYVLPALLAENLIRGLLSAGDDDDEPTTAGSVLLDIGSYAAGSLFGVRELSGTIQGFDNYNGPSGARFFSEAANLYRQAEQGDLDTALRRSAVNVSGILLHYPSGQINRTLDGLAALEEGRTQNPMALVGGAPR